MSGHTPGPWMLATSNSWRRFVSRDHGPVCEPIVQNDGHADLHFKNGGEEGPDATLIAAAPDMLCALRTAEGLLANMLKDNAPSLREVRAAIAKATVRRERVVFHPTRSE